MDQEDINLRKTGRHIRQGSDGIKPSKVVLITKQTPKSAKLKIEKKSSKHTRTEDQSPAQLSSPSRQIDPSSELTGDKEGSI